MSKPKNFTPLNFSEYFTRSKKIKESYALRYYQDLKNNITSMYDFRIAKRLNSMRNDPPEKPIYPKPYKRLLFDYLAPYDEWAKPENYSRKVIKFLNKRKGKMMIRAKMIYPTYYYEQIVIFKKELDFDYLFENYNTIEKQIAYEISCRNYIMSKYPIEKLANKGIIYYLEQTGFLTNSLKFNLFLNQRSYYFRWIKF